MALIPSEATFRARPNRAKYLLLKLMIFLQANRIQKPFRIRGSRIKLDHMYNRQSEMNKQVRKEGVEKGIGGKRSLNEGVD